MWKGSVDLGGDEGRLNLGAELPEHEDEEGLAHALHDFSKGENLRARRGGQRAYVMFSIRCA
jgi:hypothetical protein